MAKQISELSWEKRLLVISYDEQEDQIFIKSKKFISDNKCEIEDRNLEIIFYEKFKNKDYAKPEFINNKYGIWLIGYDGQDKSHSTDISLLKEIYNIIDKMPLRKREMTVQKKKCN